MKLDRLDLMLDLETLGNSHKPAVIQISAVPFVLNSRELLDIKPFNCHINLKSIVDTKKFDIDLSTLNFWLKQDQEVINNVLITSLSGKGKHLLTVLEDFRDYVSELRVNHHTDLFVWGNGVMNDNNWLQSLYCSLDEEYPLEFWQHRDVRTVIDFAELLTTKNYKRESVFKGMPHNAIDDCKFQIEYLQAAFFDIEDKVS